MLKYEQIQDTVIHHGIERISMARTDNAAITTSTKERCFENTTYSIAKNMQLKQNESFTIFISIAD